MFNSHDFVMAKIVEIRMPFLAEPCRGKFYGPQPLRHFDGVMRSGAPAVATSCISYFRQARMVDE